jgi:hypothetical protein
VSQVLILRKSQVEAFEQSAQREFEDELVDHLRSFAPELWRILKDDGVRRAVQLGLRRAGRYGLKDRAPLKFYVELTFAFGSFFDADVQLPWAGQILSDSTIANQHRRVDRLYGKMADYLERVAGPANEYAIRALTRFNQSSMETQTSFSGDFRDILSRLSVIYPEKYEYVGESALRTLISRAIETAASYRVSTARGAPIFVALMFAFGAGVAADPVYPWVSATIENAHASDPNDRLQRLAAKAKVYTEHVIANLGHK